MLPSSTSCWIVTEGLAGTENQCLGVTEALGIEAEVKRIQLKQPWKTLSPYLGFEQSWSFAPALHGPWPDLLIASGRKAIAAARYIKKASGGKSFTVFLQDPRINPAPFDLVAVPAHDPTRGKNVIVTTAAPNRITAARLAQVKKVPHSGLEPLLEPLPRPRIAVLIGGNSKAHRLTPTATQKLCDELKALGGSLMVTASRRTGAQNRAILERELRGEHIYFWDGTGKNPYFAMLAYADYILVTADSVSMLSEAATTGKPVYMIPLEGGAPRLDKFHARLLEQNAVRVFDVPLENWKPTALNDSSYVARAIEERLKEKDD